MKNSFLINFNDNWDNWGQSKTPPVYRADTFGSRCSLLVRIWRGGQ